MTGKYHAGDQAEEGDKDNGSLHFCLFYFLGPGDDAKLFGEVPKERAVGAEMPNQRQKVKRLEVKVKVKAKREVEVKAAEDPKHSFTYFWLRGPLPVPFCLRTMNYQKKVCSCKNAMPKLANCKQN